MPKSSLFASFIFLILSHILFTAINCTLTGLSIALNETSINNPSTHTWRIFYNNAINRQSFTLYFPTCDIVTAGQSISVTNVNGTVLSIGGFSPNSSSSYVTFSLPSAISATQYIFHVINVKNCYHAGTFQGQSFFVWNNGDNIIQNTTNTTSVTYFMGIISGCQLYFDGYTGDIQSTLHIPFKIQNNVVGSTFAVNLQYSSTYFSSSIFLTSYNSAANLPICGLSINGSSVVSNIPASLGTQSLTCSFSIPIPTSADNLTLLISNIANPITSTIYVSSSSFIITTQDNLGFGYDISSICVPQPVALSQFTTQFKSYGIVNAQLFPVQAVSDKYIGLRLATNDNISITFTAGSFSDCSNSISISRSSSTGAIPTKLIQGTSNNPMILLYQSNGTNLNNYTMTIDFSPCAFNMPPSTIPISFTYLFSGTDSGKINYDNYMQLSGTLVPVPYTMQQSQVSLTLSSYVIGDLSSYTFNIKTFQPLTQSPSIIIDFPSQIDVSFSNATLSSCTISINNLGVGSKTCEFIPPNSICINVTSSNSISSSSDISITINNIVNPSNPQSIHGFNIITVYTSAQPTGLVQNGQDIVQPITYIARTVYPVIENNNFTVYTSGSTVVINYQVGVNLPNGSITVLNFTNVLKNLIFVSVSPTTATLNSSSQTIFSFVLNSISSGDIIKFTFTCLTPPATGTYSIFTLSTQYNNLTYEKTSSVVTMQVLQPYANTFSVIPNPTQSYAGMITDYTFYFNTSVPHTVPFNLQIVFPSGTNLLNGQSVCNLGCSSSNFTDLSSGGTDKILLLISGPIIGCSTCYQARITSVSNQRFVGTTPAFTFFTLTQNQSQYILKGTATAVISSPNILTAAFSTSDDYYRSNTKPVNINMNVTNQLILTDYILLQFDSNSYTQSGTIQCAVGTCSATVNGSLLIIQVIPTATQIIYTQISISIQGLISSSSTAYGQKVNIPVGTFTASGDSIDTGTLVYSISCGQNASIISLNCKTCAYIGSQSICTSCYTPEYSLYNNSVCTNACGNLSKYETYPSSGVCVSCMIPCYTCYSSTNCSSCISPFYLYTDLNICQSSCNTSNSYYIFNVTTYLYCKKCTTTQCASCPGDVCAACLNPYVLQGNQCIGGCPDGTYNAGGMCMTCNIACLTCNGSSAANCIACTSGYNMINGECISGCPAGTVSLNDTCTCSGDCATCVNSTTTCLSCSDVSKFYYQYKCYSECPSATYAIGQICYNCSSGCLRCTTTTCMECISNYSISQNKCYGNCKELGASYTSMLVNGVMTCISCPNGCLQCDSDFRCSSCLDDYILQNSSCIKVCQLTNSCTVVVKTQPIMPVPAVLSFGIWCAIVGVLKLFFIKGMYAPYALLLGGALVQFIEELVLLGSTNTKIKIIVNTTARLLQESTSHSNTQTSYLYSALGLLAVAVALNYVLNFIFIYIFCRFYRPLIFQRQIDMISNYGTLIIGTITSYRLYLLSFSRLFKHPYVQISQPSKLKPVHIILTISYILDLLTLVSGMILAANAEKLTILFMLGIDITILIILLQAVFIYAMIKGKPQQYYNETKKYRFQQNYITEQGSLHNKNEISKIKLNANNVTNEKLQIEDYSGQDNPDDMPTLPPNVIKIAPKNIEKIEEGEEEKKTKRKQKSAINYNRNTESESKFFSDTKQEAEKDKSNNAYRSQAEIKTKDRQTHERNNSESMVKKSKNAINNFKQTDEYDFEEESVKDEKDLKIQNGDISNSMEQSAYRKSIKHRPLANRHSTVKLSQSIAGMKKKNKIGLYESQAAESNIDQVDLQSIVQTKMIDKTKEKKQDSERARTQVGKNDKSGDEQFNDEISPSWFNIQNQRYDIDEEGSMR